MSKTDVLKGVVLCICLGASIVHAADELIPVGKEAAAIEVAKSKVADAVRDAGGLEWREVRVSADRRAVCGEVNSKNETGKYQGFRKFIASNNAVAVSHSDTQLGDMLYDLYQKQYHCA